MLIGPDRITIAHKNTNNCYFIAFDLCQMVKNPECKRDDISFYWKFFSFGPQRCCCCCCMMMLFCFGEPIAIAFHYEASKMSKWVTDRGHTSNILANKERVKSQNITQTRMARICIWMFCLIVNVITQHIRRNIWNRHKNQNFLEEARERDWKCFLAIHDSWIICQFQRRNIFIENCFYDEAI